MVAGSRRVYCRVTETSNATVSAEEPAPATTTVGKFGAMAHPASPPRRDVPPVARTARRVMFSGAVTPPIFCVEANIVVDSWTKSDNEINPEIIHWLGPPEQASDDHDVTVY